MRIFNKEIKKWYIDILNYLGVLLSGMLFLYYVDTEMMEPLMGGLAKNTSAVASCMLIVAVFAIYAYCTCEDGMQSKVFLFCAGMSFVVLLINKNILSIWLMIIVFLLIPILFRPTAELIKRDMQLLFLFSFMLCNMSLLVNYTNIIQKEVSYSLEVSVYLEMVLAIGALIFFYYWDRLPQGVDLRTVSMVRLQWRLITALFLLMVVFGGLILGSSHWKELPDEGSMSFVKNIALLTTQELTAESSTFFICIQKGGVLLVAVVLFLLYKILRKICRKYHPDKQFTSILIILSVMFGMEFFIWKLTAGVIILYILILVLAIFLKEENREVTIIQGSVSHENEQNKESIIINDSDRSGAVSADDD